MSQRRRPNCSPWTAAAGALLFVTSFTAWAETFVVLPFANLSRTPNLDWIGESIADDLRETLAAQGVILLDRTDREEAYRRLGIRQNVLLTRASIIKIAEALDAEQVIYGEFEFIPAPPNTAGSRGTLRLSGHMLDRKSLRQGPEFTELGGLEDLAVIQTRMNWRVLSTLQASSTPSLEEFLKSRPPTRLDAVENFVRGLLATNYETRHRYYTTALRIDPTLSRVHFRLGLMHYERKEYKLAVDELAQVLPKNSHYRESQFFIGICRFHLSDFAGAQAAFEEVARDVPLSEVLNNIGVAQARRNLPDALDTLQKALEGDPADSVYRFNVGLAYWRRARFAEAAEQFQVAVDRDPADAEAKAMLARSQNRIGPRPQDRLEIRERLKTGYEETAWLQLKSMLQPAKPE
jgi:Tfp pilus assembly protein PilF